VVHIKNNDIQEMTMITFHQNFKATCNNYFLTIPTGTFGTSFVGDSTERDTVLIY